MKPAAVLCFNRLLLVQARNTHTQPLQPWDLLYWTCIFSCVSYSMNINIHTYFHFAVCFLPLCQIFAINSQAHTLCLLKCNRYFLCVCVYVIHWKWSRMMKSLSAIGMKCRRAFFSLLVFFCSICNLTLFFFVVFFVALSGSSSLHISLCTSHFPLCWVSKFIISTKGNTVAVHLDSL